jgi:hypothetical protein
MAQSMARPRSEIQDLLDRLRSQSEQLALGTIRLRRSLSTAGATRARSRRTGSDLLQMMPEIGGVGGQLRHLVHGMPHLVFRRMIAPAAKGTDRERRCFFYGAEGPAIVRVDSGQLGSWAAAG